MTSSYLSPEERQRRIERNRQKLGLEGPIGSEEQPGVLERMARKGLEIGTTPIRNVWSGIIKPVLQSGPVQTWMEYPRAATTEAIQRVGETQEVMRERGIPAGLGHIGRELGSTLLDAASTTAVGPLRVPKEWGERLDPSSDTAFGAELEAAKQEFREVEGRDPTLVELYELKAPIQDKHMPHLLGRQQIGPFDMSNRFLYELGGEAVAATGETALTFGRGPAAKVPLAAAAKMSAQTGTKAAAQRVALQSMGQVMSVPMYVDKFAGKVMGTVITAPFRAAGLAAKGAVKVPGVSKPVVVTLFNHLRRILLAQGVSPDEAYRGAKKHADLLTRANNIEDLKPGEVLSKDVDGPQPRTPWYRDPTTGEDNLDLKYLGTPVAGRATGFRGVARDSVDAIRELMRDMPFFPEDLKARLGNTKIPLLRGLLRPRLAPTEKFYEDAASDYGKAAAAWNDHYMNVSSSAEYTAINHINLNIRLLEEQGQGLIQHSGKVVGKVANQETADLAAGSTMADVYPGNQNVNYWFSDKPFEKGDLLLPDGSRPTMLGHSMVGDLLNADHTTYRKIYEQKARQFGLSGETIYNRRGEKIAPDLPPMFDQVVERFDLYEGPLRLIKITRDGEVTDAFELIKEIAEIAGRYEKMDMVIGTPNVMVRPGVHYGEGAHTVRYNGAPVTPHAFPRAPINDAANPFDGEEVFIQKVAAGPKVHHAKYLTSGEGAMDGIMYPHPAEAMTIRIREGFQRARLKAMGEGVRTASEQYEIPITKLEHLIASKATTAFNTNLQGVSLILERAISATQAKKAREAAATGAPKVKDVSPASAGAVRSARQIVEQIQKVGEIDPSFQSVATGDVPAKVMRSVRGLEDQLGDWETVVKSKIRSILTPTQYEQIARNLDQAKITAEVRSKEIEKTMATLTRFGFEGHYFPKTFADSILKTDEALRIKENPVKFLRYLAAVNGTLRTMGATADMSALGIQGIAPIFNDALRRGLDYTRLVPGGTVEMTAHRQGDAISVIRTSIEAMANNGPEIMQEFWWRFDQSAFQHGGLTSRQWAQHGLAIAQTGPDLYVSRLGDMPFMRKFNRAFTHYGNAMRAMKGNAELHTYMLNKGLTLDEVLASGKVAEIAATMNIITGVGRRGFGGELGQYLFFAPRFMHARLKTVSEAARGMLPGDKTLMQQVAARYMSRYIGMAVFITIGINEAQGKETDLSPIIRDPSTGTWRANPNFMRIHMGGLDVSLLGPYDTLLRLLALPAFVALNVKETGLSADTLIKAFRSTVSAPITASAFDLISGEDPIGRAIRDPEADLLSAKGIAGIVPTLLERSTPFAVNDIFVGRPGRPSVAGRFVSGVTGGDLGEVATAATQTGLQVVGGRSTYETPSETLRKMVEEVMGLGPDDPRIRELFPANMPEAEIQEMWSSLEGSWWSKLIDEGKNFRMSLSLRNAFGLGKEPTPTWEMVADDIRYKLEEMVEKGLFSEIMTPQAIRELQVRMDEAMAARSDDYSRYKVERDKLDSDEERIIEQMEEGFATGQGKLTYQVPDPATGKWIPQYDDVAKGDTRAYLDAVNRMRGAYSGRRSNLVGPEGKYSGVTDLFAFANGTALGTLSTFDSDVYDAAEAKYYQVLYETITDNDEPLHSIVRADGTIDWDLRDQKLVIWAKQMKKQFPKLTVDQIERFRVRVEKAREDKAPPIAKVLIKMQEYVRDTVLDPDRAPGVTYYDIEEAEAEKFIKAYPGRATHDQYTAWKKASSKVKSEQEAKNPWLKALKRRTDTMKKVLLSRNPQVAAILQAMGSGPADAYNRRALVVKSIMQRYRLGTKDIPDLGQFLADVYNMEDLELYR